MRAFLHRGGGRQPASAWPARPPTLAAPANGAAIAHAARCRQVRSSRCAGGGTAIIGAGTVAGTIAVTGALLVVASGDATAGRACAAPGLLSATGRQPRRVADAQHRGNEARARVRQRQSRAARARAAPGRSRSARSHRPGPARGRLARELPSETPAARSSRSCHGSPASTRHRAARLRRHEAQIVARAGRRACVEIEPEAELGQQLQARSARPAAPASRASSRPSSTSIERGIDVRMRIALRQQPAERAEMRHAIDGVRGGETGCRAQIDALDRVVAEMLVEPRPPGRAHAVARLQHRPQARAGAAAHQAEMAAVPSRSSARGWRSASPWRLTPSTMPSSVHSMARVRLLRTT